MEDSTRRIKVLSDHLSMNNTAATSTSSSSIPYYPAPVKQDKNYKHVQYKDIKVELMPNIKSAIISFGRQDQLATMSQMNVELKHALGALDRTKDVSSIILVGDERSFSCGTDPKTLSKYNYQDIVSDHSNPIGLIPHVQKPVIAAVRGLAVGGGFELALACDIIIAGTNTHFGLPEVRLGTIPGSGGTQRLLKAIGKSKAMEMILTGRLISAEEAKDYRLVSSIVPNEMVIEEAIKVAQEIGNMSVPIIKMAKKAVIYPAEQQMQEGIQLERRLFHNSFNLDDRKPPRVISFVSFLAIAYFCVSGGPYGIEERRTNLNDVTINQNFRTGAVSAGPPVYVLLAFLVLPFLWSYPLGMLTAELSNAISEDGGCSIWAEKAFGQEVSLLVGFFSWFTAIVDLSLYPVLFVEYLSNCFADTKYEHSTWGGDIDNCFNCKWIIAFSVIIVIVIINMWGAEKVGASSNVLAVLLILPFIILVGMGISKVDMRMIIHGEGGFHGRRSLQLGTLITTIVWSFSGYDAVGQLAGEVKNPSKNYPIGILCVLFISIITYILPVLVGMQADTDWPNWQEGQFSSIALIVGGQWLNIFMSIGGMASSVGLFNCNLCTSSRNLYSMSLRGYLPSFFSKILPSRGTPFVAITTNAIIIAALIMLPFNSILDLDMSLYSIVILFECATYVKLFLFNPEIPRPYKAIKSKFGLIMILPPVLICGLIIWTTPFAIKWKTLVVIGFGFVLVVIKHVVRRRQEAIQRLSIPPVLYDEHGSGPIAEGRPLLSEEIDIDEDDDYSRSIVGDNTIN
eukprot:gene16663-19802_t